MIEYEIAVLRDHLATALRTALLGAIPANADTNAAASATLMALANVAGTILASTKDTDTRAVGLKLFAGMTEDEVKELVRVREQETI